MIAMLQVPMAALRLKTTMAQECYHEPSVMADITHPWLRAYFRLFTRSHAPRGNAEEARRAKKIMGGTLHFDHCKLGEARRVNILTNGNEVNVIRT